jgi:hypothetical protein
VTRALLLELDAWTRGDREPPAVAVSRHRERRARAPRGRALSEGAVVPVHDLHAPSVAHGLRARVQHDACDHIEPPQTASRIGCSSRR